MQPYHLQNWIATRDMIAKARPEQTIMSLFSHDTRGVHLTCGTAACIGGWMIAVCEPGFDNARETIDCTLRRLGGLDENNHFAMFYMGHNQDGSEQIIKAVRRFSPNRLDYGSGGTATFDLLPPAVRKQAMLEVIDRLIYTGGQVHWAEAVKRAVMAFEAEVELYG